MSLSRQLQKKLYQMNKFGQSKHKAKKEEKERCQKVGEKWLSSRVDGIYSYKTLQAYKQTVREFSKWIKENYGDVKKADEVTRELQIEYLKYRQNCDLSAWTIKKDLAALNKVFNDKITSSDADLNKRSYKDIKRSRLEVESDKRYNPENYKDQILISKVCGTRRESISGGDYQLKKDDFTFYKYNSDGRLYINVIEKNGKYRHGIVLKGYEEKITNIIGKENIEIRNKHYTKKEFEEKYKNSNADYLFQKYTKLIDNHAFRREYSQNLYNEIAKDRGENLIKGNTYKGFDKSILSQVSLNIGHQEGRFETLSNNYMI